MIVGLCRLRVLWGLSILVPVMLFAMACGDDDRDRRTGIAELDAVIDAVEEQDTATLHDLLLFQTQPCTTDESAWGPPECVFGETEGTPVEVFAFASIESGWQRDDEVLAAELEGSVALMPVIYAAFVSPPTLRVGQDTPEYVPIFEGDAPGPDEQDLTRAVIYGVDEGKVSAIVPAIGLGDRTDTLLPDDVEYLIEPPD